MRNMIMGMFLLILLVSGCREVQLSPRYQQALEMSAINVRGMLKDCKEVNIEYTKEQLEQAKNDVSLVDINKLIEHAVVIGNGKDLCEKGLELSANLLDFIVNASYGRVSDANDR